MDYSLPIPQVTTKYIDWITDQQRYGHKDDTWQQQRLYDLEQIVRYDQDKLNVFYLTIDALQIQYHQYQQTHHQTMLQLNQAHLNHEAKMQQLERQQQHKEQQLKHLEEQLQYWRTDAAERRDKKAMREKQYHQVYFVPVINTQYKKKYMRARDQNNAVEQHLSDLHRAMDGVKDRLRRYRQEWTAGIQYRQELHDQQEKTTEALDRLERLCRDMEQVSTFWHQFESQHIIPYLTMLKNHDDGQWRRMTKAYEVTHRYGQQRYGDHIAWDITFDCAYCHITINGWPWLINRSDLVCTSCHHTIHVNNNLPAISPSPSYARSRCSSTTTTKTSISLPLLLSSTLLKDCKPYVKKIKSALNTKVDFLANNSILMSRHFYRSILA
ncbi:hypothetical protein BC941DRAFT_428439 [Chlamydoabsidia padenii]|nr:hypothetical protein BC941DRAFT_428439 [Chlamydoabsidia padenii]